MASLKAPRKRKAQHRNLRQRTRTPRKLRRMTRLQKIRLLNDNFRSTLVGGIVYMSRDFFEMPQKERRNAFMRICAYDKFYDDGEHDAGVIVWDKRTISWRIEYRELDYTGKSKDPADPEKTGRVLIIDLGVTR